VALLACAAVANAANYDVRGEWEYSETCSPCAQSEFHGTAVIKKMEASGAYTGTQVLERLFSGTVGGTVSENILSLLLTASTPGGEQTFTMPEGTINPATNEFSGAGYYNGGGPSQPTGTFTAKRIRTLKQIEEQEEKEKFEREGREKGEKEGQPIGEKAGKEKGEREGRIGSEAESRTGNQGTAGQRSSGKDRTGSQRKSGKRSRGQGQYAGPGKDRTGSSGEGRKGSQGT
jgi:hypothetical protein